MPRRWDLQRLFGQDDEPWEWAEMVSCLHRLFDLTRDTHSIFLFIDGLDEFAGDHTTLIGLVQTLSQWPHVKACVSSRPWTVFEDAYKQKPSLRMEYLTGPDIHRFVSDKLTGNQGFLDLQQAEPEYAAKLIGKVTERASGVFLWVALVTKELLNGLTQGDRLRDLDRRLLSLPTDLEALFRKMLNFGDKEQFQKASRAIQLVQLPRSLNGFGDFSLLDLAFADEDGSQIFTVSDLSIDRRIGMTNRMRRRLDDACKGLIEPQGADIAARVEYLHRTVKDFLLRDDVWPVILEATPNGFNASASWSQAYIMRLKFNLVHDNKGNREIGNILHHCYFLIKKAELTGYSSCGALAQDMEKTWQIRALAEMPENRAKQALLHSATINQLAFYVDDKLKANRIDSLALNELWLLALRPKMRVPNGAEHPVHDCRAEMAEVLLRHGADSRWMMPGGGRTVWEEKEVEATHAEEMEAVLQQFQKEPKQPFWESKPTRIWHRFSSK